jgi:hypothetical protein
MLTCWMHSAYRGPVLTPWKIDDRKFCIKLYSRPKLNIGVRASGWACSTELFYDFAIYMLSWSVSFSEAVTIFVELWSIGTSIQLWRAIMLLNTKQALRTNLEEAKRCKLFVMHFCTESDYVNWKCSEDLLMKSSVFRDITSCGPLKLNRSFGRTYRRH